MNLPVKPDEWFKDGLRFECTGCGNCCTGGPGYVWVTKEETQRLADFLKLTPVEVERQYSRKIDGMVSLKEKRPNARGEYDCIFLKEVPAESPSQKTKRMCTVYAVRPLQCRTWPFWNGNLASPEAWKAAGKRCPGVNAGRTWTRAEMLSRRDATQWPAEE